jgi:peptidoglycan/LPS O-acetylase OafA/YrhL
VTRRKLQLGDRLRLFCLVDHKRAWTCRRHRVLRPQRFGKETAKWSFSLYAIHYPILVLLNVMSDNPHDFTMGSLGLDVAFIEPCLALAFIFYLLFERHTAGRAWFKNVATRRPSELVPVSLNLPADGAVDKNIRSLRIRKSSRKKSSKLLR